MKGGLKSKIQDWWNGLDYDLKIELMENTYPNEATLIEVEEMWNGLDWEERYEIYSNSDNEPTEEDLEAQKTDSAERENHRKEIEGDNLL